MQNIDIFSRQISLWEHGVFEASPPPRHRVCTIGEFVKWGNNAHYEPLFVQARSAKAEEIRLAASGDIAAAKKAHDCYVSLKRRLPTAMPQGVCPKHNNNGFVSYTDVIQIDIDAPGNGQLLDIPRIKSKLAKSPFVAYCGLSVGGHGLWVLIPIADHRDHVAHWRALAKDFAAIGVAVDENTKNIGRLRFMARDPDAYINHAAKVYDKKIDEPKTPQPVFYSTATRANDITIGWVYSCVQDIIAKNIDITTDYDDWLRAAGGIAHYMGKDGESIFHAIASRYDGYNERENAKLFAGMSKPADRQLGIVSFFRLCYKHGVSVPHDAVVYYDLNGYRAQKNTPLPLPPAPTLEQIAKHFADATNATTPTMGAAPPMPQSVPAVVPQPMTPAEALEMQRMAPHIAEGVAMVDSNPDMVEFCAMFNADYCGHDDWHMTDAQFDNFFAERHNAQPPF